MPYYEYECKKCHQNFSVHKPMRFADTPEKCPVCNKKARKIISSRIGFILKGKGFYGNDYKK